MVHKGNKMQSNHTTKEAAINEAYRQANGGDTLRIHKQNGQIQDTRTVQAGSDGAAESEATGLYGIGTFETGVSDFF